MVIELLHIRTHISRSKYILCVAVSINLNLNAIVVYIYIYIYMCVCVCISLTNRELTKVHEEFWRGTCPSALDEIARYRLENQDYHQLKDNAQRRFRGEIVLIIEANAQVSESLLPTDTELYYHMKALLLDSHTNSSTNLHSSHGGTRGTGMSVKDVVDHVVTDLGVRKKFAYKIALRIQADIMNETTTTTTTTTD